MAAHAYFLTWTTYGTWLHGDDRGSREEVHGLHQPVAPNPALRGVMSKRLAEKPYRLDTDARSLVEQTIREHCERRGWKIDALNVRSNHVHIVVRAPGDAPMQIVSQLKAWATRRLRESGLVQGRERVWTEKASTRWLKNRESHARAVSYTNDFQ